MTVEIARMHKEDDQRRWLYAIVAAPLVLGSLAFLGGRVGRSISLTLVGWTAIGALVVARRRRAQNPPAGYQMPPAELMACALVAFIAAEAFGVGPSATGRVSPPSSPHSWACGRSSRRACVNAPSTWSSRGRLARCR